MSFSERDKYEKICSESYYYYIVIRKAFQLPIESNMGPKNSQFYDVP